MTKNNISKSEAEEIKALKKALENAKMQERALNTLIDIAEENLNIKIRTPDSGQTPKS